MIMMMRCLVKPERLFNSMPRAGSRHLANQALRYGTLFGKEPGKIDEIVLGN